MERERERRRASEELRLGRRRRRYYSPRHNPFYPGPAARRRPRMLRQRISAKSATLVRKLRRLRPHLTPTEEIKFRRDQTVRDERRARRRRRRRHPELDLEYAAEFWQRVEPPEIITPITPRRDGFGKSLLPKLKRTIFKRKSSG